MPGAYQATIAYASKFCRTRVYLRAEHDAQVSCALRDARQLTHTASTEQAEQYALSLNGRTILVPSVFRNGRVHLPLERVLLQAGLLMRKVAAVRLFQGPDGEMLRVTPNDDIVRDGTADVYHLAATPFLLNGDLYMSIEDIESLLGAVPPDSTLAQTAFTTRQIVDPTRRKSNSSMSPAQNLSGPPIASSDGHFAVQFTLLDQGSQTHQFEVRGDGATFRGAVGAFGNNGLADKSYGLITVGRPGHTVAIGQPADPLAGAVFSARETAGAKEQSSSSGTSYFDLLREQVGRFIGIAQQHNGQKTIAAISIDDPLDPLICLCATERDSLGVTGREVWISPRGAALGVEQTSGGRFFFDSNAALVVGKLPLADGDAPNRVALGYHVSPSFTMRAGFAEGIGLAPSAYANGTLSGANEALTVILSKQDLAGVLSARGNNLYGVLNYSFQQGQREWQADAGWATSRGNLSLTGYEDASTDVNLRWAFAGHIAPLIGYEVSRQSQVESSGVIYGANMQLGPDFSVDLETHPAIGKRALRVSVTQLFSVTRREFKPNHHVTATGLRDQQATVFLDGVAAGTVPSGGQAAIFSTSQNQQIMLRSADGRYASGSRIVGNDDRVTLPMYPVLSVRGRIVIVDPDHLLGALSLDGLSIRLSDGSADTIPAEDGTFSFPALPIEPGEKVVVDPDTLPNEAECEAAQVDDNGDVLLTIRPKSHVQRTIF
jgi:hypothetical protein